MRILLSLVIILFTAQFCMADDIDGDGIPDGDDNCPETYNPNQSDFDNDGIGDLCDDCTDNDGDGFGDPWFAFNICPDDNCWQIANPDQADWDEDGVGDVCMNSAYTNAVVWEVVKQGTTEPVDTIFVGGKYQFQIWLSNSFLLGGFSIGHIIWSVDGAAWHWDDTILVEVPGSRIIDAWDMTGLLFTAEDVDNVSPDYFMAGGVALMGGMPTGPMEPQYGFNFTADINTEWVNGVIGTICFNWAYIGVPVPPVFVNAAGQASTPDLPPIKCWPVKMICGNPNGDDDINVGDAVRLIYYVFKGGEEPYPYLLGDANLDDLVNVADVVFIINFAFKGGPRPICP